MTGEFEKSVTFIYLQVIKEQPGISIADAWKEAHKRKAEYDAELAFETMAG